MTSFATSRISIKTVISTGLELTSIIFSIDLLLLYSPMEERLPPYYGYHREREEKVASPKRLCFKENVSEEG